MNKFLLLRVACRSGPRDERTSIRSFQPGGATGHAETSRSPSIDPACTNRALFIDSRACLAGMDDNSY